VIESDVASDLQTWFTEQTGHHFDVNERYMESGHFDSFDVISLIGFVETKYSIRFDSDDFQKQDFATITGLAKLVHAKPKNV
jgi:acyl carrier protein